jgi:CheY-like chemotaxis protein
MPRRPVVLIVDEDLGLLYWLGKILAESGYQALPASDNRQAVLLVEQLGVKVDLVIVNRSMLDVIDMIKSPNRGHFSIDVVVIPNPDFSEDEPGPPPHTDPSWRRAWYRKVLRTLQEADVVSIT